MIVSLIVAMDRNRAIGKHGGLPLKIPAELEYFKDVTMGKPIIMGRKTHESIGRVLPGRTNVVVTRQTDYKPRGEEAIVASSLEDAFEKLEERGVIKGEPDEELFIIGGAEVYVAAIPAADRIYVTEIDNEFDADVFFPEFEDELFEKTEIGAIIDEKTSYPLKFVLYTRK